MIIRIKCKSDSPAFDQRVREVIVNRETPAAWFGVPLANGDCPELQYPKFAWVEVPGHVCKTGAADCWCGARWDY